MLFLTAEVIIVRKEVYPDPPSIPEGRWDVYLVSLPNRPYFPVTINFVTLTPTITSSPLSLTFEPEVWDVPQELTVIALEDPVNRDDVYGSGFKLALDSEDMNYDGRDLPDFEVLIEDNDEGIKSSCAMYYYPIVGTSLECVGTSLECLSSPLQYKSSQTHSATILKLRWLTLSNSYCTQTQVSECPQQQLLHTNPGV